MKLTAFAAFRLAAQAVIQSAAYILWTHRLFRADFSDTPVYYLDVVKGVLPTRWLGTEFVRVAVRFPRITGSLNAKVAINALSPAPYTPGAPLRFLVLDDH